MAFTRKLLRRHAATPAAWPSCAEHGNPGGLPAARGPDIRIQKKSASKADTPQSQYISKIAGNFIAPVDQGRHFAECVCCSSSIFAHCLFGEGLQSIADIKKFRNLHGSGILMAAGEGFEPSHTESESAVLPLHKPAMHLSGTANRYYYTDNEENVNP